jgi:hypothetical protein
MTKAELQRLNDAIKAGAEWDRPTVMGAWRRQNPLMAEQIKGEIWLVFVQRNGEHKRIKMTSCVQVTEGEAGAAVLALLAEIKNGT